MFSQMSVILFRCIGPHCTGRPSPYQTWDFIVQSPHPLVMTFGGHRQTPVQGISLDDPSLVTDIWWW